MFVKREDGLGKLFLPFDLWSLLLGVLFTYWCGAEGIMILPAFIGWTLLTFVVTMAVFIFVLWCISLTVDIDEDPPMEDHPLYRAIVVYGIGLLCRVGRLRIRCTGTELLPQGRYFLVCNHRSAFDPIATVWALRRTPLAVITKPENLHIPIAGPMIYKSNFLPIDREDPRRAMETIRNAAELLKNDVVSVGIYPEGTRGDGTELLPFHNGVFKIAQRAGVPLAVATITGAEDARKNLPWRHSDVVLHICRVIPPEELDGSTAEISQLAREIMERDLARSRLTLVEG